LQFNVGGFFRSGGNESPFEFFFEFSPKVFVVFVSSALIDKVVFQLINLGAHPIYYILSFDE
jgi:hypothetical protein